MSEGIVKTEETMEILTVEETAVAVEAQPAPQAEETPEKKEAPQEQEKKAEEPKQPTDGKKKFSPAGILAVVAIILVAAVGVTGIWLSLVNFRAMRGLTGSDFVGLTNYQRLVNMPIFTFILRNSLVQRILQLLLGCVAAIPLVLWANVGKNPGRTLTKACLCLVLMCVPVVITSQTLISVLPRDMLVSAEGGYITVTLASLLQTAGFIGFCGGFFSYLKKRGIGGGALQGMLAAVMICSLSILTPDFAATRMMSNPLNASMTTTMDSYVYDAGLQSGQYSVSSAASALKAALQLVLAIIPAVILGKIAKKDETRIEIPDATAAKFTLTLSKSIWILAVVALVAVTFGIETITENPEASAKALASVASTPSVMSALGISLVVSALGGLLAGLTAYGFVTLYRGGRRGFGLASVIMASSMSFLIAEYLAFRQLGVINTGWPMVIRQIFDPRLVGLMIVLAIVLRMAPERNTRGLALGLILLAAAFAWGDFVSANIYVNNQSSTPLAAVLYRMAMGGTSTSSMSETITQEQLMLAKASVPALMALVALPSVLLGFGGVFSFIHAFKKAE